MWNGANVKLRDRHENQQGCKGEVISRDFFARGGFGIDALGRLERGQDRVDGDANFPGLEVREDVGRQSSDELTLQAMQGVSCKHKRAKPKTDQVGEKR